MDKDNKNFSVNPPIDSVRAHKDFEKIFSSGKWEKQDDGSQKNELELEQLLGPLQSQQTFWNFQTQTHNLSQIPTSRSNLLSDDTRGNCSRGIDEINESQGATDNFMYHAPFYSNYGEDQEIEIESDNDDLDAETRSLKHLGSPKNLENSYINPKREESVLGTFK